MSGVQYITGPDIMISTGPIDTCSLAAVV